MEAFSGHNIALIRLVLLLFGLPSHKNIINANSVSKSTHFYTSYQSSIECTATSSAEPKTLSELQEIVHRAKREKLHVKAVGSLHSITDCICTDGIVVHMTGITHFVFHPGTNHATAGAGLQLQDFLEKLHENGRGLPSSPIYGGITVGGAVGVGVHGTNLKEPATLSDQLVSVTYVDGMGNIRQINDTSEHFKAFRVHLGLLGIVYELTFKTVKQYKLEIENFPVSDAILLEDPGEIIKLAQTKDFFQLYWFPTNQQVVMSVGKNVPVETPGNCETHLVSEGPFAPSNGLSASLELMQSTGNQIGYFFVQSLIKLGTYQKVPVRNPYFTKADGCSSCLPKAIGYSHRMMANRCKECPWHQGPHSLIIEDTAVAMELEQLPSAIQTLKEIMDSILVGFPLVGVLFRFMKSSDSYLGLSSGRDSVEIEWVSVPRFNRTKPKLGIAAFQAFAQALIERHGGRSHWGKNGLYYTTSNIIRRAYPQLPKFVEVMNRTDPEELFMNNFGRRIKYGSDDMTLSEAAKIRCALNKACLCKQDLDCGDGGLLANVCTEFMGFKVCRNVLTEINDKKNRGIIHLLVSLKLDNDVDFVMKQLAEFEGFTDLKCKLAI